MSKKATGTRRSAPVEVQSKVKSDFPKHPLSVALKIANALVEKNGGRPLPPTETAIAISKSPGSSEFRVLLSSSIKYGLTSGSFNQDRVSLEPLGQRIAEPTSNEDLSAAIIQAALNPPTFKAIYDYFRGKKLPDANFFENTVVREFKVPREQAKVCVTVFMANMDYALLIKTANTGKWLSTDFSSIHQVSNVVPDEEASPAQSEDDSRSTAAATPLVIAIKAPSAPSQRLSKVFITHGKNKSFLNPIKDLLSFGQLEPVVSVERESIAQPVPEKVMHDMRSCGSAIIHVEDELKLMDPSANEHIFINQNVLIEIGAAMALYGRRFILLVKNGVKLPSNLQGLYEVRYEGDKLDGEVTIKLLKAINEIKNHPLPTE